MNTFIKRIITSSVLASNIIIVPVMADTQSAKDLVEQAVNQKSFYYYNQAYASVMELKDEYQKAKLLSKLDSVSTAVWNDDVKNINKTIDELAKTSSGKIYDDIQVVINKSKLPEVDKQYFLGEVTSWGKRLVWTEDYSNAISLLSTAWTKKDNDSINIAEKAVGDIKNEYSKSYLLTDLNNLKSTVSITKSKLTPINVVATALSSTEIALQWDSVEGADYYYVYMSESPNGTFECFKNDDGTKRKIDWHSDYSIRLSSLNKNTTKYFKVTAVKDGIESNFTSIFSATTKTSDTRYYPLLPDVPRPDFFNFDKIEYSENNMVVSYMYSTAAIPNNFLVEYDKLLTREGWKAISANTISGDIVYYYTKDDKTIWLRLYSSNSYFGVCGNINN